MKKAFFLFIITSFNLISGQPLSRAVTYEPSPGRFGDNLLSYIHAKWVSYKNNVPLLYKPFVCSDQLLMHEKEMHYAMHASQFRKTKVLDSDVLDDANGNDPTLYIVPYFPESEWERGAGVSFSGGVWPFFQTGWNDKKFIASLSSVIAPKESLHFQGLPKDKITVAVHMRKGGNNDTPATLTQFPLKFLPNDFYIEQIKKLYELVGCRPLYIFLFTDDNNPGQIAENIAAGVEGLPIEINYRKDGNCDTANVVEDFFALKQFDCLIHSESNFSFIMSHLKDYWVSIYPSSFYKNGSSYVYDTINIKQTPYPIYGNPIPEQVASLKDKFRLYTDSPESEKMGYGNWNHFEDGEYEVVIKHFSREGQVIVDAGAHMGDWSDLVLQHTHNNCRLISFEPVPNFYNKLCNRIGNRAEIHNKALGREEAYAIMNYYYVESEGCSSLYERKVLNDIPVKKIKVPVTSLDSFCVTNKIDHIDLLKIDVEGAEWDLLLGANDMISQRKIPVIQFEYGGTYPDANITLQQVYAFFASRGYAVFRITEDGLIHIPQWRAELEDNHLSNWLAVLD